MQRMRKNTALGAAQLIGLLAVMAGCGGGYGGETTLQNPPPNPGSQNVGINGRYNLVLTSANGQAPKTINVYTDFVQTEGTLEAAATTLICPSNNVSQCVDVSIAPTGTVNGANVTIVISFQDPAGADTVTLVGTGQGKSLTGTYSDTLGRSGTWTASTAVLPFPSPPNPYDYTGTFNSTSDPLPIPPKISLALALDSPTNLAGSATIMNWPCAASLTLEGQALGDAFTVTDAANKVRLIALPTPPNSGGFTFNYKFEPAAPSCAGNFGLGDLSVINVWDY